MKKYLKILFLLTIYPYFKILGMDQKIINKDNSYTKKIFYTCTDHEGNKHPFIKFVSKSEKETQEIENSMNKIKEKEENEIEFNKIDKNYDNLEIDKRMLYFIEKKETKDNIDYIYFGEDEENKLKNLYPLKNFDELKIIFIDNQNTTNREFLSYEFAKKYYNECSTEAKLNFIKNRIETHNESIRRLEDFKLIKIKKTPIMKEFELHI
jgi:hypothetical protein